MNDTLHPPLQRITHSIHTDLSQLNDHDTVDLVVIGSGGAGLSLSLIHI